MLSYEQKTIWEITGYDYIFMIHSIILYLVLSYKYFTTRFGNSFVLQAISIAIIYSHIATSLDFTVGFLKKMYCIQQFKECTLWLMAVKEQTYQIKKHILILFKLNDDVLEKWTGSASPTRVCVTLKGQQVQAKYLKQTQTDWYTEMVILSRIHYIKYPFYQEFICISRLQNVRS